MLYLKIGLRPEEISMDLELTLEVEDKTVLTGKSGKDATLMHKSSAVNICVSVIVED